MNRPYSYSTVPKVTYKGGLGSLGSVAPYPLNPFEPDITTLPLPSEFDDIRKYGGIQLYTAAGIPSLNAPNYGLVNGTNATINQLGEFIGKYKWWIIGGVGIGLMLNMSRPRIYGR